MSKLYLHIYGCILPLCLRTLFYLFQNKVFFTLGKENLLVLVEQWRQHCCSFWIELGPEHELAEVSAAAAAVAQLAGSVSELGEDGSVASANYPYL